MNSSAAALSPHVRLWRTLGILFQAHPWHGIAAGPNAPERLNAYIEMVPTDTVKYELDKLTGVLRVDRPQRYSNICPVLYGFVPQTLCAEQVAMLAADRTGRTKMQGDGDPLDVCVLTERPFSHGGVLVDAIPVGGLRMIDGNEADDKIIAVMAGDLAFGDLNDILECPTPLIDRLRHYFQTYKQSPDSTAQVCEITHVYGRDEAHEVIRRSMADYEARFGGLDQVLAEALRG